MLLLDIAVAFFHPKQIRLVVHRCRKAIMSDWQQWVYLEYTVAEVQARLSIAGYNCGLRCWNWIFKHPSVVFALQVPSSTIKYHLVSAIIPQRNKWLITYLTWLQLAQKKRQYILIPGIGCCTRAQIYVLRFLTCVFCSTSNLRR